MATVQELDKAVTDVAAKQNSKITKDDLRTIILSNIKMHEDFVSIVGTLTPFERKTLVDKLKATNSVVYKVYQQYRIGVNKYADHFIESLEAANNELVRILKELDRNVDSLFDNNVIVFSEGTITGSMAFGILKHSDMIGQFSYYLMSEIHAVLGKSESYPYRIEFLNKNVLAVVKTVKDIQDKKGVYSTISDIFNIKNKHSDFALTDPNNNNFTRYATMGAIGGSSEMVISGFNNPIAFLGRLWDRYKYERYLRHKRDKAWLEATIMSLKLIIAEMDPENIRRKELEKAILTYSKDIADLDRKIEKYLNETT